jgi:PQQ-dependent dehydrogenase (s-GDH family)
MNEKRLIVAVLVLVSVGLGGCGEPEESAEAILEPSFTSRVVTSDLDNPWEVTWGPDDHLWVTERVGRRILRVDPENGNQIVAVRVDGVYQAVSQDGVLGMALHPELLGGTGNDYVYVGYTYDSEPGPDAFPRNAIRRYTYDSETETLGDLQDLITGLPAHDDHVGGRLAYGPDDKLYFTVGDQGSNWGRNQCNPNRAQVVPTAEQVAAGDWSDYQGKILRINLDGSIPQDNPTIEGVRSHVFSYGHRNPQGLVFAADGTFYSAEHGPSTDDEVNLIEAGKNYGWPQVAGYPDDQMYAYEIWASSSPTPCGELADSGPGVPDSVPVETETSWSHPDYARPLQTLFTVPNGFDFQASGGGTIAAGGLDIYTMADGVSGWADSLLVTSLNRGAIYRMPLSADGRMVVGGLFQEFKSTNRYRDLAIRPDGQAFYIITDNTGRTLDDAGERTQELQNPGVILEFRYAGTNP